MSHPHRWLYLIGILVIALAGTTARALPLGVRVLDPGQVLRDRTRTGGDGSLYLEDEQGTLRRFITSTRDPAILNPGDGEFHPAEPLAVVAAIEAADGRFTSRVQFDVLILPYPVADLLGSWADEEAIYLSPGVLALSDRQISYLVGHEVGHLVHRTFLPDSDAAGWDRYRSIRGIEDTTRFRASAVHRDRPHEIFAEDFRVLFGGAAAQDADPIENADLAPPAQVPGLREFFLELIGSSSERPALAVLAYPNPITTGTMLRLALPDASSPGMEIFDVTGRRIREIASLDRGGDGAYAVLWDGRDDSGRPIPRGVYYCLVRDGAATARIPIRFVR